MNNKLEIAVDEALKVFWARIKQTYPEITSGDLSPETLYHFEVMAQKAVSEWVNTNTPNIKPIFGDGLRYL